MLPGAPLTANCLLSTRPALQDSVVCGPAPWLPVTTLTLTRLESVSLSLVNLNAVRLSVPDQSEHLNPPPLTLTHALPYSLYLSN